MKTRYLIDGNNVVGSRPDGWWRDRPGAMRRLIGELDAWARDAGVDALVVFDGRPISFPQSGDGVEVAFATRSGPDAADDDIVRIAPQDADPARLVVVSSDAALVARVRAAGTRIESAGTFRRRLDAT